MKNTKRLSSLVICISPALLYVPMYKKLYEHRVLEYLKEEKGYEREVIVFIEGRWGKKLPAFYTDVVFQDEPDVTYTYFAHAGVF